MEVSEAIRSRRSIRKFREERVSREDLIDLVDYARLAPSGMNKQPLEFVVVDDPDLERQFFAHINLAGAVDWDPKREERPRAYIVLLINREREPVTENYDVGLAASNICLGAVGKGLGSCLLGAIDKDSLTELLQIPGRFELALAVGLGYPDQEIVLEEEGDITDYWLDEEDVLHVPKRPVDDLLNFNGWEE